MDKPSAENASIAAGALAAIGASTCCVVPLALVSVGLGGAWIAQLREMERFFPVFVAIAVAAFGFAFYRLYVRAPECAGDAACAAPPVRKRQRIAFWTTLISAKALIASPYVYAALAQ